MTLLTKIKSIRLSKLAWLIIGLVGFCIAMLILSLQKAVSVALDGFYQPVYPVTLRKDSEGDGSFGACRENCSRKHQGVDLVVEKGQKVYAPIGGTVRKVYPYGTDLRWEGCEITNPDGRKVRIYYIIPTKVGQTVKAGEVIGTAQAISEKYSSKMTNHIHVELRNGSELVDVTPFLFA